MSDVDKAVSAKAVEAALNVKTNDLPDGVWHLLKKGLSALGWSQPTLGAYEVMQAALTAAVLRLPAVQWQVGHGKFSIGDRVVKTRG